MTCAHASRDSRSASAEIRHTIPPATGRAPVEAPPARRRRTAPLGFALLLLVGAGAAPAAPAAVPPDIPPPAGAADDDTAGAPWTLLDRYPGEGEQCLVCGQRIWDDEVVELRYKGRTFHVKEPMLDAFEAQPERYFRKLQPRAALFDEEGIRPRPLASGWLLLGLYVLAGLLCGGLAAYLAVGRARRPLPWFFAGLAGNALALAALVTLPPGDASGLPAGLPRGLTKVPATRSPVPCPACGGLNHPAAGRCSRCGTALTPTAPAETARA